LLPVHSLQTVSEGENEITRFSQQHFCTLNNCALNPTKAVKGQDTCCSAAYMSQAQEQQHFTTAEVAADWHELMIPQHIMWPSIARANGQLDPRCS